MSKHSDGFKKQKSNKSQKPSAPPNEQSKSPSDKLEYSSKQWTKWTERVSRPLQIRRLYIRNNLFTEWPVTIGQYRRLWLLEFSENLLTKLPESIDQLTELEALYLSNNQLTGLPESIGELKKLQYLYLANNQLTKLPESIHKLSGLQRLILWNNQLTELPESIGELKNLQYLHLANNQLTKLPETIGELKNLQILILSNNQLTELPKSLKKLKSLTHLYLEDNDVLSLPVKTLTASWQDINMDQDRPQEPPLPPSQILEHYFRERGKPRPLNEARLIVIGDKGVGKTSIVNHLVRVSSNGGKNTEDIKITKWQFPLNGKDYVRLNIWDFGADAIKYKTHQLFLSDNCLYLLVLDGHEGGEDARAEHWLKIIKRFAAKSPIIVVLNKINERTFDVNRIALQEQYSNIKEFVETDCNDKTGLEKLVKVIKDETDHLEFRSKNFPTSWFIIKNKVAGLRKNYLGFGEYYKICNESGEENPDDQKSLATYLHNLGIALNYKDDPRLRDIHILNIHWVTNGIHNILEAEKLKQQKGR